MTDTAGNQMQNEEAGNWLYCEDEDKNKYVFYRGHPAFLARFSGLKCLIEGMEERFSFSDPHCRDLIKIAERKGIGRFGLNISPDIGA